ncbi:hypothetical protein BJX63DRAFT_417401 [Aspergillus granulosus]|uniref:Uncharacterized protein n=1 Tax=Aspergillus granulosus TaxID=176169 RepID=A0ABR4I5H6_9EURO
MLLSSRRTIIATCAVTTCMLLLIRYNLLPLPTSTVGDLSTEAWGGLKPYWTSEQDEHRFTYVQYANYLCNAIMDFVRLDHLAAHFDRVLIHPKDWEGPSESREQIALARVQKLYPHVRLHPVEVLSTSSGDPTWHKSLTKFHAFALTDPVAVARAYWLNDKDTNLKGQMLGSHVMLIEPNEGNFRRILAETKSSGAFDMEVLNRLFADSAMILPHRRYALLTGEFRNKDHQWYLAEDQDAEWHAVAEVSRAYLLWLPHSEAQWQAALPECGEDEVVETVDRPRCADRLMWTGLYEDYYRDQKEVCPLLMG